MLTDAHVKVLLLDRKHGKLIMCTSLYQGMCYRHQRGDISRRDDLTSAEHVVANDNRSSTVAFIAPGEEKEEEEEEEEEEGEEEEEKEAKEEYSGTLVRLSPLENDLIPGFRGPAQMAARMVE